ncbi:MAG: FG-GAP-like repeat-containing protein [Spirochaetia bacterium]|nr:FG-GAP-like repeat-containing protein [Spirochaetia bacterium]
MNRTLLSLMFVGLVASSGIYANVNPDGSFSQSIPIKLPPAKLTPEISLEYNSHAGNGMLGVGWQLSGIPFIKRVNYTSAISYTTNADTFAASDDGILVLQGTGDYFSKAESFTKYTPVGSCNGPCSWVAKTKSGLTLYFGNTTDSYIDAVGKNAARVWALSKVEDRNGNGYEVSYEKDTQNGDYYPALIRSYGPGVSTYDTVEFSTATRSDDSSSYADGALERMDRVLTRIKVKRGGTLIRQYDLSYANGTATGRSRLTSVQEFGSNGSSTLLKQEFSWQEGTTHLQPPLTAWGTGFAQDGNQQLGDFNGDGKTDILRFRSDGSVDVWVSSGSGFPTMVSWGTGFAQDANQRLADFNGDGKTDVLRFRSNGAACVMLSTGLRFSEETTWETGFAQDEHQQLADYNGDGRVDILRFRSTGSVDVWASTGPGDLLTSASNGLGSTTTVTYLPATQVPGAVQPQTSGHFRFDDGWTRLARSTPGEHIYIEL